MTTFQKLEIAGIRSVDSHKPVEIEFFKPLTLIQGPNGAGKTTLIESLRFACTGVYPPNSQTGRLFLRDPNNSPTRKTEAYVKLKLKTVKGEEVDITRKASVSLENGKLKLTTKEVEILADGKEESKDFIGQTVETSNEMLSSVIFCHQEDASWPFEEGKKLKERFDEIFGTTKYSKLIEDTQKEIKDLKSQQKETEIKFVGVEKDFMTLKDIKDEIVELQGTADSYELKVGVCGEKATKIAERLKKASEDVRASQESAYKVDSYRTELSKIVQALNGVTVPPKQSQGELDALISEIDNEIENLRTTTIDTTKMSKLKTKKDELRQKIDEKTKELGVLNHEIDQQVEILSKIEKMLGKSDNPDLQIEETILKIENRKKEIEKSQNEDDEKLRTLQNEISEIERKQNESSKKRFEIEKNLRELQTQLKTKETTKDREKTNYEKSENEIEKMRKEQSEIVSKLQTIDMPDENDKNQAVKTVKREIDELDKEIGKAMENVKMQVVLGKLNEEQKKNEEILKNSESCVRNGDLQGTVDYYIETSKKNNKKLLDDKASKENLSKTRIVSSANIERLGAESQRLENEIRDLESEKNEFGDEIENGGTIDELKEMEKGIWATAAQLSAKAKSAGICPVCGNAHIDISSVEKKEKENSKKAKFGEKERNELSRLEGEEKRRKEVEKLLTEKRKELSEISQHYKNETENLRRTEQLEKEKIEEIAVVERELQEDDKKVEILKCAVEAKSKLAKIEESKLKLKINDTKSVETLSTMKKVANDKLNK
ncbi:DNA double-strand break repair Rad50 atpase, partial [Entamoeba invadens IP1]